MSKILLSEAEKIKNKKSLEEKEKQIVHDIASREPGTNNIDEIITALNTEHLLTICNNNFDTGEYSIGYKLGINTAAILSVIYQYLEPTKFFLIKQTERVLKVKGNNYKEEEAELKKTVVIVDSILHEISKLLLCNDFKYAIEINTGDSSTAFFAKVLCLKQHTTTIPNPHDIPPAYDIVLHDNKREIYKTYVNFVHFFAGNWDIALSRLGKIKISLNELNKLCPLERLSIANEIAAVMGIEELDAIPEDIKKHLLELDSNNILFFHSLFIKEKLPSDFFDIKVVDGKVISKTLEKLSDALTNPLKNIIHFNIIFELMIKCMVQLRQMQGNNMSDAQRNTMKRLQDLIEGIYKKQNVKVQEVYKIAHEMVKPIISKTRDQEITTHAQNLSSESKSTEKDKLIGVR